MPTSDPIREQIIASFKATYGYECDSLQPEAEPGAADPELHVLSITTPTTPTARARGAGCSGSIAASGAYNTNEVYYLTDDIGGLRQLQFAEPELDIRYEDPDEQTKLKR